MPNFHATAEGNVPFTQAEEDAFAADQAAFLVQQLQQQSAEMAAYIGSVRETRERILNRLAGIGVAALASSDAETAAAVLAARRALLDITSAPAIVAATDQDSLKAAFIATYQAIVAECPLALRSAFVQVDA